MALNPTDIDVTNQFIITHMTEEQLKELEESTEGLPDNSIITTNDLDENISYMRSEIAYDASSSEPALNWGYPSGIQGNVAVTKDLTKYQYLDFVLTIYPTSSTNTGGWSGVYRLDLTTKKSSDNWCVAGYSAAYADSVGGIGNINAETWNFALYYDVVNKIVKWFIRFTNTSYNNNTSCFISKIYGVLKEPAMIYTGTELYEGNGININSGVISSKCSTNILWSGSKNNTGDISLTDDLNNYTLLIFTGYNSSNEYYSQCVVRSTITTATSSSLTYDIGNNTYTANRYCNVYYKNQRTLTIHSIGNMTLKWVEGVR